MEASVDFFTHDVNVALGSLNGKKTIDVGVFQNILFAQSHARLHFQMFCVPLKTGLSSVLNM